MSVEVIANPSERAIVNGLVEHAWVVVDNFLSAEEVGGLRRCAEQGQARGSFHAAAVGRGKAHSVRHDIRSDEVLWLDPTAPTCAESQFWDKIERLRVLTNGSLFLGLQDAEFHYACYPEGAFYRRHLDRFRDDDARVVSAICYLNPDWRDDDGGHLRVWQCGADADRYADVAPIAGRLVLFMSADVWHEVLPATRPRWSLTGWLRRAGL